MPPAQKNATSGIGSGSAPADAQQWETAANHASDPLYVQLPYEVVFVATPIVGGNPAYLSWIATETR